MKKCITCKVEKDESEFCRDSSRADGLNNKCKTCAKNYLATRKEKIAQKITAGEIELPPTKECLRCSLVKDRADFYPDTRYKDGLRSWCVSCEAAEVKDRRKKNEKKFSTTQSRPVTKECSRCKQVKTQDEFYVDNTTKDGLGWQCKECNKESRRLEREQRAKEISEGRFIFPKEKKCSVCGMVKAGSAFYRSSSNVDGLQNRCMICDNAMSKKWHEDNIEKAKEYTRKRHLKATYGIMDDCAALLDQQKGGCAICGAELPAAGIFRQVDHNHKTNKVRGVLCMDCNRGLGGFGDDPVLTARAVIFLWKADFQGYENAGGI